MIEKIKNSINFQIYRVSQLREIPSKPIKENCAAPKRSTIEKTKPIIKAAIFI